MNQVSWITQNETPTWLTDLRQQQWNAFIKKGLPTRKDERFKYADFSFLANKKFNIAKKVDADSLMDAIDQHRLQQGRSILLVFVNGYFMPLLSDLEKMPHKAMACHLSEALTEHADLIETNWRANLDVEKYPFASLNAALCHDGLFFYLPDHVALDRPVHLLSIIIDENEVMTHPYHMFVLGEQSQMTLVEEHFSFVHQSYLVNTVSTILLNQSASLEYYKLQNEGRQATHMAHTFIQQKQDSQINFMNFSSGSLFARDDIIVKLQEPGASCQTTGFYHLRDDNQYIDNHVDIDHAAPRSNSEMLFKGILENKSRAVFNGRLHVEKDAQKILAYQANHNLLLSNDAEVYSKPELEIYADDVKCKHGATTGQLDQDALFYLRARGIPYAEAMNMLLQGFAEEIIDRITLPGVKSRVLEMVKPE